MEPCYDPATPRMNTIITRPLIDVSNVGTDWVRPLSVLGPKQEDDYRWFACDLWLTFPNGETRKSEKPLIVIDNETKRDSHTDLSSISWLRGANLEVPELPKLSNDQMAFQGVWDCLLECKRILQTDKDLFHRAAYDFMRSDSVRSRLEALYCSDVWKRQANDPIPITLPELGDCVLFKSKIWTVEDGVSQTDTLLFLIYMRARSGIDFDTKIKDSTYHIDWRLSRLIRNKLEDINADRVRKPLSEAVRHEVWRRDDGKCTSCGSREKLEFDHIVPVSRGGSDTPRNIQLLCEPCNR